MLDTKVKVFHESISCFMKWPWNCISWNALKEKFHSVSFPLQKEIKDLTIEVFNLSTHFLSFKSFPVWDHAFMTSIRKVGGGWRGGVLKFGTCLRTDRSIVHFYRWEVGWGSKNCFCFFVNVIIVWQLILKVTSIKRNVFSFILLRFKPNILHAY